MVTGSHLSKDLTAVIKVAHKLSIELDKLKALKNGEARYLRYQEQIYLAFEEGIFGNLKAGATKTTKDEKGAQVTQRYIDAVHRMVLIQLLSDGHQYLMEYFIVRTIHKFPFLIPDVPHLADFPGSAGKDAPLPDEYQ